MKTSWLLAAIVMLSACDVEVENDLTVVAQGFDAQNDMFMFARLYATATSKDAGASPKIAGAIAGGTYTMRFQELATDVDFAVDYFVDRNNDGKCSPKLDLAWRYAVGKVPASASKTVTFHEDYDWTACQRSFEYAVTGPSISGKHNLKITITGLDDYDGRSALTTMPGGATSTTVVAGGKTVFTADNALEANPISVGLWVDYNGNNLCEAPESTEHDGVFKIDVRGGAAADVTYAVNELETSGPFCYGPKKGNVALQDLGGAKFSGSVGKRLYIAVFAGSVEQFRTSAVVPAGGVKFFVYNVIDVPLSGMTVKGFTDVDGNGRCNGTENTNNSWTYIVSSNVDVNGINRDFSGIVANSTACNAFP